MKIIFAILICVALFALVIVSYRLNKNTPVPEGCENLKPECQACGIKDCSLRGEMLKKIEEELEHGNH